MLHERIEIAKLGLTDEDEDVFAERVWQLMTSSRERSIQEYERLRQRTLEFLRARDLTYVSVDEPQGTPASVPPIAATKVAAESAGRS